MKSCACPIAINAAFASSPTGSTTASHMTDGAVSSVISTCTGWPDTPVTAPSFPPTTRGTAPACCRVAYVSRNAASSTPSATNNATRRVRIPVLPGRLNSDSAGETSTSDSTLVSSARGCASGTGMPSPSATPCASTASTFTSTETIRSRTASVCTRVNSNRKALMICVFSTSD